MGLARDGGTKKGADRHALGDDLPPPGQRRWARFSAALAADLRAAFDWISCRSSAQLRFYRIEGGGHRVPSIAVTDTPMTAQRFGRRKRDIEAAEEIWNFARRYTR